MSSKWLAVLGLAALVGGDGEALAQKAPPLGKAASFAVLGSSVSSSGDTLVTGDLGFNDTNGVGRDLMRLGAAQPKNSSLVRQAQRDAALAYVALGDGACIQPALAAPLQSGIYCLDTVCNLLTLAGDADAVWIFRVAGDLSVAPNTAVRVIGGGHDWNVFWQVGGNVTLGARTVFVG